MRSRAEEIKEQIDNLYKELFHIQKNCNHKNITIKNENYYCIDCAQPLLIETSK